jgi:hypothetical protein
LERAVSRERLFLQWSPAADVFDGGTCASSQVRFKLVGNLVNITMIDGVIRGVDGALNVASNKLSFEFDALHNAGTSGFFQVGPSRHAVMPGQSLWGLSRV